MYVSIYTYIYLFFVCFPASLFTDCLSVGATGGAAGAGYSGSDAGVHSEGRRSSLRGFAAGGGVRRRWAAALPGT